MGSGFYMALGFRWLLGLDGFRVYGLISCV